MNPNEGAPKKKVASMKSARPRKNQDAFFICLTSFDIWTRLSNHPVLVVYPVTPRAKTITIADKIANLTDLLNSPPADWPAERIRQYVAWSRQVVAGCRGHNEALEIRYDEVANAL